ncbi:MAG TPA: hypothetical protein DDW65_23205 [Firmicutes bacterium]|jgi:hypothetical protein|nr:hypothetical protein [Bacillota bacterium]
MNPIRPIFLRHCRKIVTYLPDRGLIDKIFQRFSFQKQKPPGKISTQAISNRSLVHAPDG